MVHGAALNGIHLQDWSINATGTFTLYQAVLAAGVSHLVLASSMAVYGDLGAAGDAWQVITEDSPLRPTHVYGLTKGRVRGHRPVLGMFVPETFELVLEPAQDCLSHVAIVHAAEQQPEAHRAGSAPGTS